MVTTYNELYLSLRRDLRQKGVEAAGLEARELLCAATGKSQEALLRDMALYAPSDLAERVTALVARRMAGEPLAYILGQWDFYGLTFSLNSHVLIPRPDTELLVDRAVYHLKDKPPGCRVLDLCAGSGCIGIAIASALPDCRVVLLEASPEALLLCRENIRRNELEDRVTELEGDVTKPPDPALWDFDLICCNPPYIPSGDIARLDASVRDFEPHLALDGGADGLDFYRTIAPLWADCLCLGGQLLFEVGIGQAKDVRAILEGAGYENVTAFRDMAGIQRVVEGRIPYYR